MFTSVAVRRSFLAFALVAGAGDAWAAGDGGTGDTPSCSGGKVWDRQQGKCVEQTGALDTDSIYETGRELAIGGRYGEAISLLSLAAGRGDPRVLNYLGYSHRMQGRVLAALGYYREALRVDPGYTLAREYMGEAYLQIGELDAALAQLAEIEARCGVGCAEYAQLSARIEAFERES